MKNGMQDRIDSILSSLDHAHRAPAPEYLYTRIKGQMQQQPDYPAFWLLRPVPLIAILLVFLLINTGLVWNQESVSSIMATTADNPAAAESTASPETAASAETEVPYAVATESRLHDNVTFYDNGREISSR